MGAPKAPNRPLQTPAQGHLADTQMKGALTHGIALVTVLVAGVNLQDALLQASLCLLVWQTVPI